MPVTIEKNEIFEFYQYLPYELRSMVIEEMYPDDRCRFTRCSKSSQKEAKASKKFVYGLEISCSSNYARITVLFSPFCPNKSQRLGYVLEFTQNNSRKLMKCRNIENKEIWRTKLPWDVEVIQFATQFFKNMLHDNQNIIKKLVVNTMKMEKFEVRSFKRLEDVDASYEMLVSQILPKLRRPLKYLGNIEDDNNSKIASCEEVYHVENNIFSWTTRFTNEQFLRLKASEIFINIGELSVENIYDFINLWKNGKIRKNFKSCAWHLVGSTFNRHRLFSLFGVDFEAKNKSEVEIKNNVDPTKTAVLVGYSTLKQMMFMLKRKL